MISLCSVSSGTSFALWVCQQHNIVNEKIGKKTFPCNIDKINERWKTGSDVCWLSDKATLHDEQDEEE
jgi:FAD-linked sulfhydryl oxidase